MEYAKVDGNAAQERSDNMNRNAEDGRLVLIAEDEKEIADILAAYLRRDGLRTLEAYDGMQALDMHETAKPDLVVLDIQMPRLNGWELLSSIRQRGSTPVLMLTAMDQDVDKIVGLRTGADDYVVKPFNPLEVVARVQAILRRAAHAPHQVHATTTNARKIKVMNMDIDTTEHSVHVVADGISRELVLTLTEFRILLQLAQHPRRVFTRAELLESCLPEGDAQERTVDSHVSKLRRKLDEAGSGCIPHGVRGVGYKLAG